MIQRFDVVINFIDQSIILVPTVTNDRPRKFKFYDEKKSFTFTVDRIRYGISLYEAEDRAGSHVAICRYKNDQTITTYNIPGKSLIRKSIVIC